MQFQDIVAQMNRINAKPAEDLESLSVQVQQVSFAVARIGDFIDKQLTDHLLKEFKNRYEGRSS